jgi:hypothetical protein
MKPVSSRPPGIWPWGHLMLAWLALAGVCPAQTILTQPTDQSALVGGSVTFSVSATNSATYTGGFNYGDFNGWPHTNVFYTGRTAGTLNFSYLFGSIYDRMTVYYDGSQIYDTGYIGGPNTRTFTVNYGTGTDTSVTVIINEGDTSRHGSSWEYHLTMLSPIYYQWQFNGTNLAGFTNATCAVTNITTTNAGSYRVVVSDTSGAVTSVVATLTVQIPPAITQPPASLTVLAGASTNFSVTATGTPAPSYQWQKDGTNLAGATLATYAFTNVQAGDAGNYSVVITNAAGTTNAAATLTVLVPPAIVTQPPASLTVLAGDSTNLTVTVSGTAPFAYQWCYFGTNVGGATNSSLSLANLQTTNAGDYTVVITSVAGSVTSSVAVLTVNRRPQTINFSALPDSWVGAAAFPLSATASSGLPVSYTSSSPGVATVSGNTVTITGAGSTLITASQAGDAMYLPATNVSQTLRVGPLGITSQPAGLTVNVTSNASFSVTATGAGPFSYQWRKAGVNVGGAATATLTLHNVQTNQAGDYAVVITNVWGSVTSSVAVLTINRLVQTLSFDSLPDKRMGAAPFPLTATASSGLLPVSFKSSNTNVATVSGNTVTIAGIGTTTITASQAGDATYQPAADVAQTLRVVKLLGTVVAWGYNYSGQTNVPAGLSGVVGIAAGFAHTAALQINGTVVAWGNNGYGQTNIPSGLSNVVAVAAGDYHTVALKTDGTVVAWGNNGSGQTSIPAGLSGVTAIAAGGYHTVVLKSNGTMVAWGDNVSGQTNVPAGLSGVTAIAAGRNHTVALQSDGSVVAWGSSSSGQTNVPPSLHGVMGIAAGGDQTAALKGDGTVLVWGNNSFGQTNVPPGLSGVTAIAAGGYHIVVLKSGSTMAAWGDNGDGQTNIPPSLSGVMAVAAGGYHTVALVPLPDITIASQPASLTVAPGGTATFNVTTTGTAPVFHQWQFNGVNIFGATTPTLTLTNVQTNDAGGYRVVVTDSSGTATSAEATLKVLVSPSLASVSGSATNFSFSFPTVIGSTYVTEAKFNLNDPVWTPIATNTGTGGSLVYSGITTGFSNCFFRVVVR